MDETDLRLMYLLKKDARTSLTKLGAELSMSVPAVAYRMNRLIEDGIIQNFTIRINEQALTPNHVSYLMKGRLTNDTEIVFERMKQTGFFDELVQVAAYQNFYGRTRFLSSENLTQLIKILRNSNIHDFEILTILTRDEGSPINDLVAEDLTSIYCPLCQEKFDGQGIVTTVGMQIMGFCCVSCKNEFLTKYEEITK